MKKQLTIILLFLCWITQAQKKVVFNVTSGATYSNIRGNEVAEQNKYDFDFTAGIGIEIPLNSRFSFVTGLNFDNKRFKNKILFNPIFLPTTTDPAFYTRELEIQVSLQYLTQPLLFRYYLDKNNNFYLNSGAFIGVFLNSISKIEGRKIDDNSNSIFSNFDFGWAFGVGSKIKISNKHKISLELRNALGLVNVSTVPVQGNGTVKTNSLQIILGYDIN